MVSWKLIDIMETLIYSNCYPTHSAHLSYFSPTPFPDPRQTRLGMPIHRRVAETTEKPQRKEG